MILKDMYDKLDYNCGMLSYINEFFFDFLQEKLI